MRRIGYTCGCIFVVGLIVALGFRDANLKVLPTFRTVRVDQATCDRILPGMTRAEVEKIIGGPDGWYGISMYNSKRPPKKGYIPTWVAKTGEIVVEFDKDRCVTSAKFYEIADWQ
jgi:outer membrane protein assembly factor BamE (lipoprotein component of BamABCDE complex)